MVSNRQFAVITGASSGMIREMLARQGFEALMKRKDHIFASSWQTKVEGELGKFIPQSIKAKQHKKMLERKPKTV